MFEKQSEYESILVVIMCLIVRVNSFSTTKGLEGSYRVVVTCSTNYGRTYSLTIKLVIAFIDVVAPKGAVCFVI